MRDLYTAIVKLNGEAAEMRVFEVAYHLLAAALHAAAISNDEDGIQAVIRLAAAQGAAVDAAHDHRMATMNATRRGTTPLYETLVTNARAKLEQIHAQRIIDAGRSGAGD
jgi:uncharacterized protein with PhoU and TrkA domain